MKYKEGDNFFKRFYHIRFWIGLFVVIPFLTWGIVFGLTNLYDISYILAIVSFVIYVFIFFYLGLHRNI
jgi:hypothetical protein